MKNIYQGNQRKAYAQCYHAFDFVVGQLENEVSDGLADEMPPRAELIERVYDTVMNCDTRDGMQSLRPIKEVRFVGTDWIMERINELMDENGYLEEVEEVEAVEEPTVADVVRFKISTNGDLCKKLQSENKPEYAFMIEMLEKDSKLLHSVQEKLSGEDKSQITLQEIRALNTAEGMYEASKQ